MKKSQNNSLLENNEESYRSIFDAAGDGLIVYDIDMEIVIEANLTACQMHGYTRQEFIGLNPAVFMPPKSYVLFREHVQLAEPEGVFAALVVHRRKDGSQFYVEVRRSAINYRGRPCLLSVIRDVSQRIQTEKILNEQIKVRMREQAALLAISHTLASTLELQPGLILDQLHGIIKYNRAGLFRLEDLTLSTLAMRGSLQLEHCMPFHIQVKSPEMLAALFNGHRPIRIADVWSDDPQAQFLHSLLDDGAGVLLEGMRSWMWVPLAVKDRIIGGVGVAHKKQDYFTPHHADLAFSVANQAAITMINAELSEHARELAVLKERQRLAQNLHDAVNQSLFSAGLIAEVLPRLWERNPVEARRSLEDLRRLTRGALAEMRALLAELRPSTLTDTELGDLLRLLGNAFTGRTNIPVILTLNGEGSLPAETQVTLYRICQEVLINIAKHANASQVDIDLHHTPRGLDLQIRDNGQGFVMGTTSSGHYGLGMMQERAEAVEAVLTITSQPGQGTEVAIHWEEREGR